MSLAAAEGMEAGAVVTMGECKIWVGEIGDAGAP